MRAHKTLDGGELVCDELSHYVRDQHGDYWCWDSFHGAFRPMTMKEGTYAPKCEHKRIAVEAIRNGRRFCLDCKTELPKK